MFSPWFAVTTCSLGPGSSLARPAGYAVRSLSEHTCDARAYTAQAASDFQQTFPQHRQLQIFSKHSAVSLE